MRRLPVLHAAVYQALRSQEQVLRALLMRFQLIQLQVVFHPRTHLLAANSKIQQTHLPGIQMIHHQKNHLTMIGKRSHLRYVKQSEKEDSNPVILVA
jgi:hypothetical protein